MQYRAEFPIEFPEKPGKSIGNSALYCIFPDPGNFSILPVLYVALSLQTKAQAIGFPNL